MFQKRREAKLGLFRFLAVALFIGAVPVALIATNIRFAASEPRVYDYSVRRFDAASLSGIPEPELIRANRELARYLRGDREGPLRVLVRDEQGRELSLFNARETAHLADVRDLFRLVFTVQQVAVAVALAAAVLVMVLLSLRALAAAALAAAALTVGLLLLVGLGALLGFEELWTRFHLLAFTNDLWLLNPARDHLIQMFPEPFWREITLALGALTLLEAMLLGGIAALYLFLTRRQAAVSLPAAPRLPLPRPPVPQPRPRISPPRPRHFIH